MSQREQPARACKKKTKSGNTRISTSTGGSSSDSGLSTKVVSASELGASSQIELLQASMALMMEAMAKNEAY